MNTQTMIKDLIAVGLSTYSIRDAVNKVITGKPITQPTIYNNSKGGVKQPRHRMIKALLLIHQQYRPDLYGREGVMKPMAKMHCNKRERGMKKLTKQGIGCFMLESQFDTKTELYLIEAPTFGLGVLVSIWQKIYAEEGYFVRESKDLLLVLKHKFSLSIEDVSLCITLCLEHGVFDKGLYEAHQVLTSEKIQDRYFDIASKTVQRQIDKSYLLGSRADKGNKNG